MRPARRAHNAAVLVVPNVKVRMEAEHSIAPLSLHDLLGKGFLCRPTVSNFSERGWICVSEFISAINTRSYQSSTTRNHKEHIWEICARRGVTLFMPELCLVTAPKLVNRSYLIEHLTNNLWNKGTASVHYQRQGRLRLQPTTKYVVELKGAEINWN